MTAATASKPFEPRSECGSDGTATASAISPSGTLLPNSHGHDATLSTNEATVGPTAKLTPATTAFMPTLRPSLCGGR